MELGTGGRFGSRANSGGAFVSFEGWNIEISFLRIDI